MSYFTGDSGAGAVMFAENTKPMVLGSPAGVSQTRKLAVHFEFEFLYRWH